MFTQAIIVGIPPNFTAIKARFPEAVKKGVIFSYGTRIYNPHGVSIPATLRAHEATHGERQENMGVDPWWERYLIDQAFVLDEEIYAHHAEYKAFVRRHGHRLRDLDAVAGRLSGPLYNRCITLEQAKHAILTGEVK